MIRTDDGRDFTASVGSTALCMAGVRALESARDCPLFTDPFAKMFIDAAAARGWTPPAGPAAQKLEAISPHVASRTKWFDEYCIAAGANGIEQVVILAPGLDARAWRLPWVHGTVVYEIDQPRVLEFKTQTLGADDAQTRYVPVPVEWHQDWSNALRDDGFDPHEPVAWAAEGLLANLSADAAQLLLKRIDELSAPGSRLAAEAPAARCSATDWLTAHGWEVSTLPAATLLDRYGRCRPGTDPAATPHTVLVEGRLPL